MSTKFKTEVHEAIEETNAAGDKGASGTLFDNGNKNEVPTTHNEGTNTSTKPGEKSEGSETESVRHTESEKSEGAKTEKEKEQGEKVETRGRKPLTQEQKDEKARRDRERYEAKKGGEGKTAQTSLIDDLRKYKTVTTPPANQPPANQPTANVEIDLSKYISGALLLIVIDSFFPSLILMIMGFVDHKYKYAKREKLKLTPTEKKELEPLADAMIKLMFGLVHPAVAFLIATGMLYAGKVMSLDDDDFNIPEKAPAKKTK